MSMGLPLTAATKYEMLGAGTAVGVTVTAAGSINTKGSYATIGTTTFGYDGFILSTNKFSAAGRFRIDIAVNTGGADTILVTDLFIDFELSSTTPNDIWFPLRIPSGGVVKMRCQSNTASRSFTAIVMGYTGDANLRPGYAKAISCTDWTNTDPTNLVTLNGTTLSAWAQVQASTTERVSALYSSLDTEAATLTSANLLINIGWGAAASEKILITRLAAVTTTRSAYGPIGPWPCDIPKGSRLAVQMQADVADVNTLGLSLLGLVA